MKQVDGDMKEHVFLCIFLSGFFGNVVDSKDFLWEGFREVISFGTSVCQILEESGRHSTFGWMLGAPEMLRKIVAD